MKKIATLLLFLSIVIAVKGQFILNPNFQNAHLVPCPGTPNDSVMGFDEWKFYQTTNDSWDGPIDTNICINVYNDGSYDARVAFADIDSTRRLFIASTFRTDDQTLLQSNYIYNAWLEMYNQLGSLPVNPSWNCNNGPCSCIRVNVQVPDSSYTGYDYRYHVLSIDSMNGNSFTVKCFPTEKFDTQKVVQMIVSLSFKNITMGDTLIVTYANVEPIFDFINYVTEMDAYQVVDTEYAYYFNFGSNLVMYNDTTYPSPEHISYVYAYPGNNQQTTPQHITAYIESFSNVVLQCFTEMRGAPVSGSPGVFHHFTLVDNGGSICLNIIGDKHFYSGDGFQFNSGMIEFGGILSCFVFHNGSTFQVNDGATMNYGNESNFGVLSIRDKTNLIIGKNATLNIYNRMFVFEDYPNEPAQQFYMTLNPTSTLRFMPGSHLSNLYSIDNTIKVNVYMKGGILDDGGLPEEDRKLINRIYETADLNAKITVYPQPTDNLTSIRIDAPEDEDVTLTLVNSSGSQFGNQSMHLQKGINEFQYSLDGLSSGMYLLRVKYNNSGENAVANIIKGN